MGRGLNRGPGLVDPRVVYQSTKCMVPGEVNTPSGEIAVFGGGRANRE